MVSTGIPVYTIFKIKTRGRSRMARERSRAALTATALTRLLMEGSSGSNDNLKDNWISSNFWNE
jgi:hypothetical protein